VASFCKIEYQTRRERLFQLLKSHNLDGLVLYASKPESGWVRYYSGFEPSLGIMDCAFLCVSEENCTVVTNAFWEDQPEESKLSEAVVTADFPRVVPKLLPPNARRIGLAPLRQFPADTYQAIRDCWPDAELTDMKSALLEQRRVKSPAEIDLLRRIAAIADRGGEAFAAALRSGVTEKEIAAQVEYSMSLAGSGPFIFSTLVAAGPRTARFIAAPADCVIRDGDIVQLDCGPSLEGYHGDYSRVLVAGTPSSVAERLIETTAGMYEICVAALRPGRRACDVALEVLDFARRRGYNDENFYQSPNVKPGFVGHGIGLGNPDVPQLSPQDSTVLEEHMVINIETILRDPRCGAARIEDAVVIKGDGAIRLCRTPIRLRGAGA
jgi:Xaa-Pro aminopeptidase